MSGAEAQFGSPNVTNLVPRSDTAVALMAQ